MDLLAAWKQTRSPKTADALDALGPDSAWLRIAKLPASRAKTAVLQLAKTVDDPRLATLYLTWLAQGNWPAPTAKIVWTRIFDHLAALRDVRAIPGLRTVATKLPAFVGEAHRAWIVSMIEQTVKTLSAVKPTKDASYKAPAPAPKQPATDPLEPIWKTPDDDDLKQVVADALIERGDPRGELITLQLLRTPNPKQRKRMRELLDEHAARWLGPIGKLALEGSWRFENGFPVAVAVDRRAVPRREWEAALAAPQWSTIRRLCINSLDTPKWWITEWVKAPTTQRVLAFEVGILDGKRSALRIERERGKPWRVSDAMRGYTRFRTKILGAFVAGLSKSERAAMVVDHKVGDRDKYLEAIRTD